MDEFFASHHCVADFTGKKRSYQSDFGDFSYPSFAVNQHTGSHCIRSVSYTHLNANPFLINLLREYGFGCDCSSYTELMLSEAIGCVGKDIMFSSNDTPAEDFQYAAQLGATINLDDITHIDFLEKAIGKIPERISCRFNPGGVFEVCNGIMDLSLIHI